MINILITRLGVFCNENLVVYNYNLKAKFKFLFGMDLNSGKPHQ